MPKKQKSTTAHADNALKNVSDYRHPEATRAEALRVHEPWLEWAGKREAKSFAVEIKGFEDDQTKAKHTAARRWVEAVNNWGQLRRWAFHVCRNPQLLDKEMEYLAREESGRSDLDRDRALRGGL